MQTLYKERPFDRKIIFPMVINPLLNPIKDVAIQNDIQGYIETLNLSVPGSTGIMYIHVPFCRSICTYCSYDRVRYDAKDEREYITNLTREMDLYSNRNRIRSTRFFAVSIGGGTPNVLSDDGIKTIFCALRNKFTIDENAVINVEIGLKAYSDAKLTLLKNLGCNRISFGVQSFDANVRKKAALTIPRDDLNHMIYRIKQFGFDINFDLMFGLPGQNETIWESDLKQAVEFEPASLDIYCYYPINSKYYSLFKRNQSLANEPKDELSSEAAILKMTEMTFKYLQEHGYIQETAEDFAKPGKFSIVKAVSYAKNEISDNYVYLGIGPNSIGNIDEYVYRNRFYNVPKIKSYVSSNIGRDPFPIFLLKRKLSSQSKNLVLFPKVLEMEKQRIGSRLLDQYQSKISKLKEKNLVIEDKEKLRLTDLGKLWIDNISYEFMSEEMKANFETSIFSFS